MSNNSGNLSIYKYQIHIKLKPVFKITWKNAYFILNKK